MLTRATAASVSNNKKSRGPGGVETSMIVDMTIVELANAETSSVVILVTAQLVTTSVRKSSMEKWKRHVCQYDVSTRHQL
jgi:hypothetical protein